MLRTITFTAALGCVAMLTGCAAAGAAPDEEPGAAPAAQTATPLHVFMLRADSDLTADNVTPALVASAGDDLRVACEATPDKAVRIFNPYAPGTHEDVPCSALLAGGDVTGETSSALTREERDGPTGQARQEVGPISFLFCGLFVGGSTAFLDKVLCPRATTEHARRSCGNVELAGGIALGILCSIPF